MQTTLIRVIIAFASGAVGAAMGGVLAIILTAAAALAGIAANLGGAEYNIVSNIAFGMFLGPHVSFGPACCAAAYAAKKELLSDSHDVVTPLASLGRADVLLVGGVFGIAGLLLNQFFTSVAAGKVDTIAVVVLIMSITAKWLFGGSPIGKLPKGARRFGRDSAVWLPWQSASNGMTLWLLGFCGGTLTGYIAYSMCELSAQTGNQALYEASVLLVWAFALIAFLFLAMGKQIPIINHIGIMGGYAARMAFDLGGSLGDAVLWAVAFGLLSAYAGDLLAKVFDVNGLGYVDPPSIVVAFFSAFPLTLFPLMARQQTLKPFYSGIPYVLIACITAFAWACTYRERKIKPVSV